jgi:hypothetical protein
MHEMASQYETAGPANRVVLLGASNLSRGFPIVVRIAQQLLGSPLEIVVAKGHGRSYGQESSFFGKKFCGILQSNLWTHLEQNGRVPTYALITDVGNDILYGVSVETILQWVAESVHRLHQRGAKVVMADLPIDAIRRLGKVRFLLLRTLFFPACRLPLETILARAKAINRALQVLAKDEKVALYKVKSQWYGLDPIHIRRSCAPGAWSEILGQWSDLPDTPSRDPSSVVSALGAHSIHLAASSFWRLPQRARQPIDCPRDGTTIAQF